MSAQITSDDVYSARSHARRHELTLSSARCLLAALYRLHRFDKVVDVGCGVGTWLQVSRELGASRTCGLEGRWLDKRMVVIDPDDVTLVDLEQKIPDVGRFDLAVCLEVGEHLTPGRAESFVGDVCRLSDTVLFGAAIPGQGGAGH